MTGQVLTPASREEWLDLRRPTIGASEAAAILGVHPSPDMTPFALWARKSGAIPPTVDNKHMRRGRLLEPIGIELLREERPEWSVEPNPIPGGKFYRDLEACISCTPDTFVVNDAGSLGVCQIKTVDPHVFRRDWVIEGDFQLPIYVAIQVMQEIYLTGATWGCVEAIVGFDLESHIIPVDVHAGVIARITREAKDFMRRVRENDPPPPDYGKDGKIIAEIYAEDDGGTVDLSARGEEVHERVLKLIARRRGMKEIEAAATEAKKERETIDAELKDMLGNAMRGTLGPLMIEAKAVHNCGYTVEPFDYRPVKIKQRKAL